MTHLAALQATPGAVPQTGAPAPFAGGAGTASIGSEIRFGFEPSFVRLHRLVGY